MTRRKHFDAGHNKPEHTFEVVDKGDDFAGIGRYSLRMNAPDYEGVAAVDYDTYTDDYGDPRIEVDYLKSHREGQGNAKRLMEHLYQRYPKHHIDWGMTISPASTHLASQFEEKYYNRTSYQPEEGID